MTDPTIAVPDGALSGPPQRRRLSLTAPMVAITLGVAGALLGWRGVDLPAQVYRVSLFHAHGLTIWDSQWYGGHWTMDYSVIFPPVAGVIGVEVTALISAAVASLAFDRLVIGHFGLSARFGSVLFALGTVIQMAIGQLPFLLGEALALAACWAATRRRWPLAVLLALATSLASPLAGAFLGLAAMSWLLASWPRHRVGIALVAVAVAVPVAALSVLFPGQGTFPYPTPDFLLEVLICLMLWWLVPKRERVLRIAARLYVLATAASFVLPTPMGGNIGRLGEVVAIPLVACLLWPVRRWLVVVAVTLLATWQWTPAWGAMTSNSRDPSTHRAYYQPVLDFLQHQPGPAGRVEVVPTRYHWEAAYVAPTVALARGWERQLDTADNPLFYTGDPLAPDAYRVWLISNGVRYVALPDAPLDYAAQAEATLVEGGVTGLQPVWHDAHWQVFSVVGSEGIVEGPARLVSLDGGQVVLDATTAGSILLRVRYSSHWTVTAGNACAGGNPDGWTTVQAGGPGLIHLQLRLVTLAAEPCPGA